MAFVVDEDFANKLAKLDMTGDGFCSTIKVKYQVFVFEKKLTYKSKTYEISRYLEFSTGV